ncbi:MAG: hypothetical protein IKJ65_02785 [Clostridia bacterium]|nr:hypothetical protein [Clostridia bacterium]
MNIDRLINKIHKVVDSHRLDNGVYARWIWNRPQGDRDLGINEYGCADAANILYTIGQFPSDPAERDQWVKALRSLQNPETGMYSEKTHHTIHTTAHCLAALELFDAQPDYPLTALMPYLDRQRMEAFLAGLNWTGSPWNNSHQGAGLYAALAITRSIDLEWKKWYFDWLSSNCDPVYGMSPKGTVDAGTAELYEHMCGWFHYMFNHNHAHMPFPHPERLIDSCLSMYANNALGPRFGKMVGFKEIDWVFCVNRACRQTGYRFKECHAAMRDFAEKYVSYLNNLDWETDDEFNDLHMLFGAVCALAELQLALPGELESTVPLKLVLDRRPFI